MWPLDQPRQCIGTSCCCYGVGYPEWVLTSKGMLFSHTSLARPESSRVASLHRALSSTEPAHSPTSSFSHRSLASRKPPQPSLREDGGFRRSDMPCHSPHVSPTWPEQLPRRPFTQCDVHACLPAYSTCDQQHTLHVIVQGAPRSTPARPPPKTSQPTR
jgi:hypothetical protein